MTRFGKKQHLRETYDEQKLLTDVSVFQVTTQSPDIRSPDQYQHFNGRHWNLVSVLLIAFAAYLIHFAAGAETLIVLILGVKIALGTTEMPTFLSLPREVRDIIYEYCLSVPHVLIPYRSAEAPRYKDDFPPLGLLSVSKTVRQEALPVLFRSNIWYISDDLNDRFNKEGTAKRKYRRVDSHPLPKHALESTIFYKYRHFFRSVVLEFCNHSWLKRIPGVLPWLAYPPPPRYTGGHMVYVKIAIARWKLQEHIRAMMPNLKELGLDTRHCSCPPRCCRMGMLGLIFEHLLRTTIARDIKVVLYGSEEVEEIDLVKTWRNRGLRQGEKGLFSVFPYRKDYIDNYEENQLRL